jgi:hypothetical protein
MESVTVEGDGVLGTEHRSDGVGNVMRLIDVLRSTMGVDQITAGSKEVALMVQHLSRFQQAVIWDDFSATIVIEGSVRTVNTSMSLCPGANIPGQDKVKSIKSQQASLSRERERMVQGIQERPEQNTNGHGAAVYNVLSGFGEDDVGITQEDSGMVIWNTEPSASVQFGPSTSFSGIGKQLAESLTLNERQSIALRLLCRHLDRVQRSGRGHPQLCEFIGGEGGTGKSVGSQITWCDG